MPDESKPPAGGKPAGRVGEMDERRNSVSSPPDCNPISAKNPVSVLKLTPAVRAADGTRAFATVRIGAITINGIRVLTPATGGHARVELPHLQAADGRRWACVSIDDADLREYVSDAVLGAWRDAVMFLGLGAKHR